MSADPREAAFHEAGHCYVAIEDAGRVVNWMRIYQDEHGWGGETDLASDGRAYTSDTTIAVAGIVAEARYDANNRGYRGEGLVVPPEVREQIKIYAEEAVKAASRRQKIRPIQVTFRTQGGNEGVSSLSPNDALMMPSLYRDRLSIRSALGIAVDLCENDRHWAYIEKLADAVLKARDNCIFREEIESILGRR